MTLLKLLSVLLDYPDELMWQHRSEVLGIAAEADVSPILRWQLIDFVDRLLGQDPLDVQAEWLQMFDRGRSMSLLMFEHLHGESRDRGQAMVDLVEAYQRAGFELAATELPDYLPLVLEFLSEQSEAVSREWLSHLSPIIGVLASRAMVRGGGYHVLFDVLLFLSGEVVNREAMDRRAQSEARDDTPQVMDAWWDEEAVRFAGATATSSVEVGGEAVPTARSVQ